MQITATITDVGDHDFLLWDSIGLYETTGQFASIVVYTGGSDTITTAAPAADVILEDTQEFGQIGHALKYQFFFGATDVAANRLRAPTMAFVEGDLISREYDGMYLEAGAKALLMLMQTKKKSQNTLLLNVLNEGIEYAQGDGPFDMHIPNNVYKLPLRVT
jgi:hypothetical protein